MKELFKKEKCRTHNERGLTLEIKRCVMSIPGTVSSLWGRRGYPGVSGDPGIVCELVVEQGHVGQDGQAVRAALRTRVSSAVAGHVAHVQQWGDP